MMQKIKVARVATVPFFLDHQLKNQFQDLIQSGFEVTAIASSTGDWSGLENVSDLTCLKIDIQRQPSLIKDLISLINLYRCFKQKKFDVVHSTTPKAGLLCAIAGRLAKVPVRLHTFTGQVWATKRGLSKKMLCFLDKVIVSLNTRCYADSESQQAYLNKNKVGDESSVKVLGNGSVAGVDLERFNSDNFEIVKHQVLAEQKLVEEDFVVIFIGRLSKEKGVYELFHAVEQLSSRYKDLKLLLVGPCEEPALAELLHQWKTRDFIRHVGETKYPEKYLSVSNLLCLPSYREGFGTVVIEAAAMKLPTLGTNVTGLVDAVDDGVTGVLVGPADSGKLQAGLERFVIDPNLCVEMGESSYLRCRELFDSKAISKLVETEYLFLLQEHG